MESGFASVIYAGYTKKVMRPRGRSPIQASGEDSRKTALLMGKLGFGGNEKGRSIQGIQYCLRMKRRRKRPRGRFLCDLPA